MAMEKGAVAASQTRFLLDTNAFIALEPFAGQMEAGMGPAATFMRLAMKQGNRVFVHPATKDELVEGQNADRVRQRLAELAKFEMLEETPSAPTYVTSLVRSSRTRTTIVTCEYSPRCTRTQSTSS